MCCPPCLRCLSLYWLESNSIMSRGSCGGTKSIWARGSFALRHLQLLHAEMLKFRTKWWQMTQWSGSTLCSQHALKTQWASDFQRFLRQNPFQLTNMSLHFESGAFSCIWQAQSRGEDESILAMWCTACDKLWREVWTRRAFFGNETAWYQWLKSNGRNGRIPVCVQWKLSLSCDIPEHSCHLYVSPAITSGGKCWEWWCTDSANEDILHQLWVLSPAHVPMQTTHR